MRVLGHPSQQYESSKTLAAVGNSKRQQQYRSTEIRCQMWTNYHADAENPCSDKPTVQYLESVSYTHLTLPTIYSV